MTSLSSAARLRRPSNDSAAGKAPAYLASGKAARFGVQRKKDVLMDLFFGGFF